MLEIVRILEDHAQAAHVDPVERRFAEKERHEQPVLALREDVEEVEELSECSESD